MTDNLFKERHIDIETAKDLGIARVLNGLLNEKGRYFVLINKKGFYFHYRKRYPGL